MTILDAIRDSALFGPWFPPATWRPWLAFLAALFGLQPEASDLETFERCTGRSVWPDGPAREGWVIAGRRGGKSRVAALVAVFLACFRDYSAVLAPGERGVVMILASDRTQARVVFRYVRAFLTQVPMLRRLVEAERSEEIDLTNGITLAVHTSSFRSVRGYTLVAAILDEVAFWRSEDAASPDVEVVAALRPGMATVPGALLLGISSPYARRGVLWDAYRAHWGQDDSDALVWKAPTDLMNPTIDSSIIQRAYAADEARARAEYGAEFRSDVEGFLSREAVEAVVIPERRELPPLEGIFYRAFVDPSGGSNDAMTMAIGHSEEGRAVLDLVREVIPPFSPEAVVADFTRELGRYRISRVTGDRYAGEWPREQFRKRGVHYEPAGKNRSDLYREFLPAVNAGLIDLLDHGKLVSQLCALERRVARSGRDAIDHPPGGHDDLANAVAGVAELVLGRRAGVTWADLYPERARKNAEASV